MSIGFVKKIKKYFIIKGVFKIEESIDVDELEVTYIKGLGLETIIIPKDYIHSVTF